MISANSQRHDRVHQPEAASAVSEIQESDKRTGVANPMPRCVYRLVSVQRHLPWPMFWALAAACAARYFWGAS